MSFPNGAPSEATVNTLREAYEARGLPGSMARVAVEHAIDMGDASTLPYDALTAKVAEDTGLDVTAERNRRMQATLAQIGSAEQFGILM